jgi:hypothetical protein
MDLLAALFGASIIAFSLVLVYRFGIKPEREQKKRQAELMHNQIRRQRLEAARNRARLNHSPTIKAS